MGNCCSPKMKLVSGHLVLSGVIIIGAVVYGALNFLNAFDTLPALNDESCQTFALRGPEDITALTPDVAFIGSDDRQNWLIKENIDQTGVPNGEITRLTGVEDASIDNEYSDIVSTAMLADSGFPDDIDFHPHGMSITPDWVSETEK